MYAVLKTQWINVKNCEEFPKTYEREKRSNTYIYRAIIDWSTKTIYETWEIAKPKIHDDKDWVELNIKRMYGPYGTKASVKTALSKIKKQIKDRT